MAAVAKQPTGLSVADMPTSQLTPNFFDSIFNDGMNPFDECFGSLAHSINPSLLASTLRKEHNALAIERPQVLKDEILPTINTKLDQILTPEQSPKSLTMDDASLPLQLANFSRSPSPFGCSITAAFPDSPVSTSTPITSPEDMAPVKTMPKDKKKNSNAPAPQIAAQKHARKSLSVPKATKANAAHKRNQSLPQNWNLMMQVLPQNPESTLDLPRPTRPTSPGFDLNTELALKAKPRFAEAPAPQTVSRMDGIFVTESIPSTEIKPEPNSPTAVGFKSTNTTASRKRKRSSPDTEEDDEDDSKLNESEKRARFLERNRVAASKCRKKKKLMNQRLEEKSRLLVQQNRFLSATLTKLRGDLMRLKQMMLTHHGCGHAPIEQYLQQEAGKYLAIDNEEAARKLKEGNAKANLSAADADGIINSADAKLPAWLNEFHSFQEVESEVLKRSDSLFEFGDDDFQKLLLDDD